jgi:hypothetical protein
MIEDARLMTAEDPSREWVADMSRVTREIDAWVEAHQSRSRLLSPHSRILKDLLCFVKTNHFL